MLTYRRASEADREYLYDLHKAAMLPYVVDTFGPWDDAWQREHFLRHFQPDRLRIIQWDGEDVGVLHVQERAEELFIASIEVHPDFQHRGIGTAVMQGVISDADRQGKPVALRVLKGNIGARSLYQRLGFGVTGENETHYLMAWYPKG